MVDKILKWVCPECGKDISSIYKNQFEFNKEAHLLSHKKGVDEEVESGKRQKLYIRP